MRKLTYNEIVELRACKDMVNGQAEFFSRAKRMYADDPAAMKKLDEMDAMRLDIEKILENNEGAVGAYAKSTEMYYHSMDELLAEMGYSAKPVEEKHRDLLGLFRNYLNS